MIFKFTMKSESTGFRSDFDEAEFGILDKGVFRDHDVFTSL